MEQTKLKQLIKLKTQYQNEIEELRHELEVVKASVKTENNTDSNIAAALPNNKESLSDVLELYDILTNISVKSVIIKENPEYDENKDNLQFIHEVQGNIETLKFTIIYETNKSPNHAKNSKALIKNLQIFLSKKYLKKEIENGINDIITKQYALSKIMLFLKDTNSLNETRKLICKQLQNTFKDIIYIGLVEDNGFYIINCKKLANLQDSFNLYWCLKWNSINLCLQDYFNFEYTLSDKVIEKKVNDCIENISNFKIWNQLNKEEKFINLKELIFVLIVDNSSDG